MYSLTFFQPIMRRSGAATATRGRALALTLPGLLALMVGASLALLRLSAETILICAISLALVIPIFIRTAARRFDPFEPCFIFGIAYGVMFVARPAETWASRTFSDQIAGVAVDFRTTFTKMLILALVGAVGFGTGYLTSAGRRLAAAMPQPPSRTDSRTLLRLATAFGVLGCLLFGLFLASTGVISGLRLLFAGRSLALTQAYYSSSSYFSYGLLLLIPAIMITFTVGLRERRPGAILLALLWLCLYLAIQIPLGDRIAMLPLLGGLLIYRYVATNTQPRLHTLVIVGVLAVFGSAVLVGSRTAGPHKKGIVQNAAELWHHPGEVLNPITKGGDGAEAPDLAAALTVVPARTGYTWGASTLADFFIRPIPRSLWSSKPPIPRARVITMLWPRYYYLGVANPEFSVLLYPYLDAGLPGVLLLMIVFGVIARAGYDYLRRYRGSIAVTLSYSVALPMLVMAVRDSPVDIVARAVFIVVPVWVAFRLSSPRASFQAPASVVLVGQQRGNAVQT